MISHEGPHCDEEGEGAQLEPVLAREFECWRKE